MKLVNAKQLVVVSFVVHCLPWSAAAAEDSVELAALRAALPTEVAEFTAERAAAFQQAANALEARTAEQAEFQDIDSADEIVRRAIDLVALKSRVDALLEENLARRGQFAAAPPGPARREPMRRYLHVTATLIDLSGRLRYLLFDAVTEAAYQASRKPELRPTLVDALLAHKSSIGAAVLSDDLFDPPPAADDEDPIQPASPAIKARILELMGESGETSLLPTLGEFAADPATSPELLVCATAAIRRLGMPQKARPERDPKEPRPLIDPGVLAAILRKADFSGRDPGWSRRRDEQLGWLDGLERDGESGAGYRLGDSWLRPGDWLLMRNPSPYNLFTDLSPGLFTHVGIITDEVGSDGRRRFVLVDLPERGKQIQTTTIDFFVNRTLHYLVLRHPDPQVAAKMAEAARAVIGNPSQFDLNFRTDRLEQYVGKSLDEEKIHTYCAGLLLLAAQQTDRPRSEFFPVTETTAHGRTADNLVRMGMSVGEDFASPTGAIFSTKLEIVARRRPMYEPGREVEEAIFDHFALQLAQQQLNQSRDVSDELRLKLAEASKGNPLLAKAIAGAAGVDDHLDLVAAAKAAAVVETLDEVAQGGSAAFHYARRAMQAGPAETMKDRGFSDEEIAAIDAYRRRHAELFAQWAADELSPRQLRIALVDYYIAKGKREIDERFFAPK
jgi:hypothetical protein